MFQEWEPLRLLALLGAGLAAGFINVNAGGGSLITLPALIFLGLPTTAANATNRVGLVLQNTVSSSAFAHGGRLPLRLSLLLLLPSLPGAWLGTRIALELDALWFRRILAFLLLFVLAIILRRPKVKEPAPEGAKGAIPHPWLLGGSFFFLGIYAGVIQAGAGFLIIAAVNRLGGLDLVRTNAVKVFVVLVLQLLALAMFWREGQVWWLPGLVLGTGTMIGGYVGTHVQMDRGEVWVRRFLVVCVLAFAAKLLVDSFRMS